MKISLAMICKATDEEAKKLDRALTSVGDAVDEMVVTITGSNKAVEAVCTKHGAKVSHFEWVDDFSKARNYSFSQCTGDWILWLDADDLLKHGDKLKEDIALADAHGVTGLWILYHYSHDTHGQVEDAHWKLQVVKAGHYEWKGVIHEDLLPTKPAKNVRVHDVTRVHTATKKEAEASLERNLRILESAIVTEPNEPRHYFYLARCYLGTENWAGVIEVIHTYLTLSHWKQERYDAMNMMGEAYMRLGDNDSAIKVHTGATLELEDAPDAYIYKARNYIQKEAWNEALTNLEIAATRNQDNVVLKRAALYDHDMYLMSAVCLLQIADFGKAKECAEIAYKNRKTDQAKELVDIATQMLEDERMTLSYRRLGETMVEEKDRLKALIASMPGQIKHDPRILALIFSAEQKEWAENSVAIFCGDSLEAWDGDSVRNGGIGGSETAVIEIASRLAKEGKEVVVYNRCDADYDGKVIDGVTYKNYWQFNRNDSFNVLWIWRRTDLLDHGITAKKVVIDMHDTSNDSIFTPSRLAQIDHVFVKSEYHKSLFPSVPVDKFVVVGNGIDMERFLTPKEKKPAMMIYTSTPGRGLENILDVWNDIKERISDAELHIFYGWNSFYQAHRNDPIEMEWMKSMQAKMEQPGIVNHGRVGQVELAEYQKEATFWLYPTEFPEIHCITALEMQASRVYPITTGYAALQETQVSGIKLLGDPKTQEWREKFVDAIVSAYENQETLTKDLEKGYKYAQSCDWEGVTKVWSQTLW